MALHFSLRELAVFVSVARLGTVTEAALHLGMTQSAASQALATLEQTLELALFDRVGRRLVLSSAGQLLLGKAQALLEDAGHFADLSKHTASLALTISASSTIANYLLPPAIATFLRQQPTARLQLQVGNTADVIDAVANFRADLGFIEGPCHHPELTVQPWRDDELVLFSAPGALPTPCTIEQLQRQPWVLREAGSGTRDECERLLLPHLGQFEQVLELGDSEAISRTVAAGYGVSCLSRHVIADALARGTLQALQTPLPALRRPLYVIRHQARSISKAEALFLPCIEATRLASGAAQGDLTTRQAAALHSCVQRQPQFSPALDHSPDAV